MNEIKESDYFKDLQRIKETIRNNQNKAMTVVNSIMIMTYYEIGRIINQRKTWGSKYIQDNDTISLLLCRDADSYVTKTSLSKSQMKLGVSKYKFITDLPEYLNRRLRESL